MRRKYKNTLMTVLAGIAAVAMPGAYAVAAPQSTTLPGSEVIKAQGGVINITPKFHGSLEIEYAGLVIAVDPVSAGGFTRKAGLILITHAHGDHFDKAAIKQLTTENTYIVAPRSVANQLTQTMKVNSVIPLNNNSQMDISTKDRQKRPLLHRIETVPMYNVVRGPKPGQKFHPQGVGNGYVITLGGKRIYIAGDTEATPEMRALQNIDIAFLPMNLPFTMTPQEAASGARAFKPKTVYPYHYRYPFNKSNGSALQFAAALKGSGIAVRLLNWYPAAAVARATAH